jgi:hypothetical protein
MLDVNYTVLSAKTFARLFADARGDPRHQNTDRAH